MKKEKVFILRPNPSVAWGETEVKSNDELNVPSCKECLTDDEIAIVLAPAALFAVETLFRHRLADVTPVMAVLRHRGGIVEAQGRERALALL